MKRILLDIDGVVADLVWALCEAYPQHQITPEHFREYSFEDCGFSPHLLRCMRMTMSREGFCVDLPLYPGALEFCDELRKLGDVVAVTKPYPTGKTWAYEREQWCRELGIQKVIHTGHKEYVRGDVFIEDCVENAANWLHSWPESRAIIVERPWNRKHHILQIDPEGHVGPLPGLKRARDYRQVLELVQS